MDKEEILRKSRSGKRDEGILFAEMQGQQLGIVLFATVAGVLALFSITQKDLKTLSVTMALVFIFHASISFGKYYYAAQKIQLLYMLISIVATIFFFGNLFYNFIVLGGVFVNKEEILARSRAENKQADERETVIATQAFAIGGLGMAVMFLLIMIINLLMKQESAYDLFALYFSFLASGYLFEYKLLKTKKKRNGAICYTLISLVWLVLYIWKG